MINGRAYRVGSWVLTIALGALLWAAAIAIAASLEDERRIETLNREVVGLLKIGDYGAAEVKAKEAFALAEKLLGPQHRLAGDSLDNLANVYRLQGRNKEVELLFERDVTILNKLFSAIYQAGDWNQAEAIGKEALARAERGLRPDHPVTADALNNLGVLYASQEKFADAEPLYKRALAIRSKTLGANHPDTAASFGHLGSLYTAQGRYRDAEPPLQDALAIYERVRGHDHRDTAISLSDLAMLYVLTGRFAEAEQSYKRSWRIVEKLAGPTHSDTVTAMRNLAVVYSNQGRYGDAALLDKRVLDIVDRARGPDHPETALSLNNLAVVYIKEGRYAEAEPLLLRATNIGEKAVGTTRAEITTYLGNLAALYRVQGRFSEAEPLLKRALAICVSVFGPEHAYTGGVTADLAELYHAQGRYAEAEPLMKRALAIREKALGPEHPNTATSLGILASLYQSQVRYAEAEPLMKRALEIRKKYLGPEHPDTAASLSNLALLYHYQSRYAEALPRAREGTAVLTGRFADSDSQGLKSELQKSRSQFASYLRVFFGGRGVTGETEAGLNHEAFAVAQWARGSEAGEALQKMAARSATGSDELATAVKEREAILARLRFLDQAIVAAAGKPANQRYAPQEDAWRKETQELTPKLAANDALLRDKFPEYYALTSAAPLEAADAAKLLGPKEALVVYAVGGSSLDDTFAFVLEGGGSLTFVDLKTKGEAIAAEVKALRLMLDPSGARSVADLKPFDLGRAQKLYETIFKPLEASLAGIENVIVIPDGALESLPFQVLVTKVGTGSGDSAYRSSEWLSDRYALTTLPSVISLKALRGNKAVAQASDKFLGFGDPALHGVAPLIMADLGDLRLKSGNCTQDLSKLEALPSTEAELKEMASALGASASSSIFLKDQASEKKVYELNASGQLKRAQVVAFATHALTSCGEGQFEPAIVLTPSLQTPRPANDNGLLTASEITGLSLNADWVILSACDTAAPDGTPGAKPLSGLARAFFYAGARSLLVSHWPVDGGAPARGDIAERIGASQKLVEALFADGNKSQPRATALANAMRTVRNDNTTSLAHPALWAPFVIVGEGSQ